eukprot:Phypoly_transcript_09384.p1 GENE.Phypoly_transcript_09384~~Phypoly_transcript_09384.p1  ORF type:complete len:314 (+),score=46.66 Phypoly_transcript_09384:305-1246(+)
MPRIFTSIQAVARVHGSVNARAVQGQWVRWASQDRAAGPKRRSLWWGLCVLPIAYFGYNPVAQALSSTKEKRVNEKTGDVDLPDWATCLPADAVAGDGKTLKTKMLEGGANVLQHFDPINSIHMHLCALHFYNGDLQRQVQAHHFCTHLTEDLAQCVIYDNDKPNSRLIGVEFIISERLYKTLSEDEKKMWHSHVYEIKSGQLTMPGIPEPIERIAMKELINTYGKTWHFWQIDKGDALPLGIPQLMMALTEDGQITPQAEKILHVHTRGISVEDRKEQRKDIKHNPIDPSANSWEKGEIVTLKTTIPNHEYP